MKILFICDEYPPGKSGGIGSAVKSIATALAKEGHSIFIAGLYSYEYGEKDYEEENGIRIWRKRFGIRAGKISIVYKAIRRLPQAIKQFFFSKSSFDKFVAFVEDLVEKEKIGIIEVADWNQFMFESGICTQWPKLKVPLVLRLHGSYSYFNTELLLDLRKDFFENDIALLERADAVSAVSSYTADRTKSLYKSNRMVQVLYNGVAYAPEIPETRNEHMVIFTGSLAAKKGIADLVKAWNEVHSVVPDARLYVCGKGKVHELSALLSLSAAGSVTFTGHLSFTALQSLLQSSSIGCFPSYSETFGLGVVEAMNAGCAVIYGDCGPAREVVEDGNSGVIVKPGDTARISSEICALLRDRPRRDALARHGRMTVKEKFDIVNVASQHIEFYKSTIQKFSKVQ